MKIIDISYDGNGVAKENRKVIFVPHTDIGEDVRVEILKQTSKFDIGSVSCVVKASPYRVTPPCPYFNRCAGCDFQHLTYERELELKCKILKDELKKVGFDGDIALSPCAECYHYRNKIKLSYRGGELGYISSLTHDFVAVDECMLAEKDILAALADVRKYLKNHSYKHLKNVTLKSFSGGVLLVFLFSERETFNIDEPLTKYPVIIAVGEVLESGKTKIVKEYNATKMKYEILGETFDIDAKSFLQVNKSVAEKLYSHVIENVAGDVAINAYSGQGVLSKLLAKKAKKVIGIEVGKSAHMIAEKIKTANMTNINAKVEDVIEKFAASADAIVLDPAREGCKREVIGAIVKNSIKKVVYISCNFSTLVRDLKELTKFYKIASATLFDMFPRTANMETCLILEKF